MRLRISIRGHVRPSVRPSVGPSPVIFERRIWLFLCKKSLTDFVNNGTMSDDDVVASDVPRPRGTCSSMTGVLSDDGFEYTRGGNPTRKCLEECIAKIDGGNHSFVFSSGVFACALVRVFARRVCVCASPRACLCVCVFARALSVCVRVCAYLWARSRLCVCARMSDCLSGCLSIALSILSVTISHV